MGDTLNPGDSLRANESIVSANGRYRFVYQDDGNLVLYKIYRFQPWRSLWVSATAGRPAGVCVMQSDDGNLVIYDPTGGRFGILTLTEIPVADSLYRMMAMW